MVLLIELLMLAGIVYGGYRLATRPDEHMSAVDADRAPAARGQGPLTADELVAMPIPLGFGYCKADVDRLLDRVAQQLPRATYEPTGSASHELGQVSQPDQVSLTKADEHG